LLSDERDRLRRRLEKLDENIAEQQRRAPDQVEKEFAGLKRNALAASNPPRKNTKPSEPKKTESKVREKSPTETKPKKTDSKPPAGEKPKPKPNKP
jgi:hypothetical protein